MYVCVSVCDPSKKGQKWQKVTKSGKKAQKSKKWQKVAKRCNK